MARQQVLVQLSGELLAALDQEASATGRSRSDLIRDAVGAHLAQRLGQGVDDEIVYGYQHTPQTSDTWVESASRRVMSELNAEDRW